MFNSRKAQAKYFTLVHQMREAETPAPCETRPELFFPDGYDSAVKMYTREAKALCDQCPFKLACLDYALEAQEEYGIWAGTTPEERREMLKRPRISPALVKAYKAQQG